MVGVVEDALIGGDKSLSVLLYHPPWCGGCGRKIAKVERATSSRSVACLEHVARRGKVDLERVVLRISECAAKPLRYLQAEDPSAMPIARPSGIEVDDGPRR